MAEQLAQMAGPGAQIFVDGFRGGRLPPKDQIQQIRFRSNSFAAEYHEAGMVRVEVITKPGMGGWRSRANFGFRDESMNATNAFASERAPEQLKRVQFSSQGPIVKGKTSVSFSVEGNMAYDSQTIVARCPTGDVATRCAGPTTSSTPASASSRRSAPATPCAPSTSAAPRIAATSASATSSCPSTPTAPTPSPTRCGCATPASISKSMFSELKFEFVQIGHREHVVLDDPTVRVLDAFTRGGAGQSGVRDGREFIVDGSFDFTVAQARAARRPAVRGRQWDSTQQTNANGTYTFSSLADFEAGLAQQFSRRVGDPLVSYSQYQAGWYLQDDFRLTKNLQVSLGLRQELQTHVDDSWNLAPRAAFTWTVAKTNIRGGWGIFYDWFDSGTYEQTVRVDGTHRSTRSSSIRPIRSRSTAGRRCCRRA